MESIFHEKQEGALCAQHCLNALLQGPYYTAVDLATLANQLDEIERNRMAEGSGNPENEAEYRRFLAQPSANMDDTGFFSLQVLTKAIEVFGLELVNMNSSDARTVAARRDPVSQQGYICNFREHWFTIRKIGRQWFDLNSLLTAPALITDTYLAMFLAQLQQEGYSIYVVFGNLPDCAADQILSVTTVVQHERPQLMTVEQVRGPAAAAGAGVSATTRGQITGATGSSSSVPDEDKALNAALALSLAQRQKETLEGATGVDEDEDLRLAIQLSQSMSSPGYNPDLSVAPGETNDQSNVTSEEDAIQIAIQMSLKADQEDQLIKRAKVLAKNNPISPKKSPTTYGAPSSRTMRTPPTWESSNSSPSSGLRSPAKSKALPKSDMGSNIRTLSSSKSTDEPSQEQSPRMPMGPPGYTPAPSISQPSIRPTYRPSFPPPAAAAPRATSFSSQGLPGQFGPVAAIGGQRLGSSEESQGARERISAQQRQSTPDPEEVRKRRQAFLDKMQKKD